MKNITLVWLLVLCITQTIVTHHFAVSASVYSKNNLSKDTLARSSRTNMTEERYHSPYKLKFGVANITFPEVKYFEAFYEPAKSFLIGTDFNLLSSYFLTLGVGAELEYFSTTGQQKKLAGVSLDDENTKLESTPGALKLTLLPYKFNVTASLRPFGPNSIISFDVWGGYQELYFEELRTYDNNSLNVASRSKQSIPDSTNAKQYVNKGWNTFLGLGASINLLLNPLDEKSTRSLERTMGFKYIYLSPFYEQTQKLDQTAFIAQQKSSQISFAHENIGLAFTFLSSPK